MQIWIDNTGLQSAGLCLEGRARRAPDLARDYDVRGLFQLATLMIYSNRLSVNEFEHNILAKQTSVIVERLRGIGVTENILSINPVTEDEYALACKTAADTVAPNLGDAFNPERPDPIAGLTPDLPREILERQVYYIALANEREGSASLQEAEANALTDKGVRAIEYMMACSPALREAVARILTTHTNWEDKHSYNLNVLLRYHLNDALAEQSFSRYAPAIARAERVNRQSQHVIEALERVVDKAVSEFRDDLCLEPLGVPSTLAALMQRSRGEPQAVFQTAMELRQHSKPLRDALETLAPTHLDGTREERLEVNRQIRELGQQLRRDVGLATAASPWDAVEIKFVIGVPVLAVSGQQLNKLYHEHKLSKKTAVLSELVKAAAYSDLSTDLYERLRKHSTRNSR